MDHPASPVALCLKSGQSRNPFPGSPLLVSRTCSLAELRSLVSRFLGGTPAPTDLVLARAQGESLVELGEQPRLQTMDLFVFTLPLWRIHNRGSGSPHNEGQRGDRERELEPTSLTLALSSWMLQHYGDSYTRELRTQQKSVAATKLRQRFAAEPLVVGIVGGGFAGLFAGLLLQSIGIEFQIFESSPRFGGRIHTWYSSSHEPGDPQTAGLYGELGGMRLPQFAVDMLPVQHLSLVVNAVLKRMGMPEKAVRWRKFYYDSPEQRIRYNRMPSSVTKAAAKLDTFGFTLHEGGDVPEVWLTLKQDPLDGSRHYYPVDKVMDVVLDPFIEALNVSFASGFDQLLRYDEYSMWAYLTQVFTLGDLQSYYDPSMGAKSDHLPWPVASYLETTNVGSGMYSVSFTEMVIAVFDWGGSKDPYRPLDSNVYMLTVEQGMQRLPDACTRVLNSNQRVSPKDGKLALMQVGLSPNDKGVYVYDPPHLCDDARPLPPTHATETTPTRATVEPVEPVKKRLFTNSRVTKITKGDRGVQLEVNGRSHEFDFVITTLPFGAYLKDGLLDSLWNELSFGKAQSIRECHYMPAFKAFLTFKNQFWIRLGKRQPAQGGLGVASTDHPIRQIIYPSYGYEADQGVLQIYCWAQDARKLGALSENDRLAVCLKGIQFLYPDCPSVADEFAGNEAATTLYWDEVAAGGAFALHEPGQFKHLYASLLLPEMGGQLLFAGEGCSVHHGWIVGALNSAYNAVYHILKYLQADGLLVQLREIWGCYQAPDIDEGTVVAMEYDFRYNRVDRDASSKPPNAQAPIYGTSSFVFDGNVPAFIRDFGTVPRAMKRTQWDANVALRAQQQPVPAPPHDASAVALLEHIYYGNNFQTVSAPKFWLKDDDEFARQQLGGFMPNLLTHVTCWRNSLVLPASFASKVAFVADYRQYLSACTVTPVDFYLAKPVVFFEVSPDKQLMPLAIQLDPGGEFFTPNMENAENAWLLAKMQTNCAGQTLHDVGFHQLLTHQICAMVSISLFSSEVFPDQSHPVFRLIRPHVVKTVEFQQSIYNKDYDPNLQPFPATRRTSGAPGVYNIGFVYDLIFSCGRIGNYQLQERIYGDEGFRFLDCAVPNDAKRRGVAGMLPFSYPYVHDATLWYEAMRSFVDAFVAQVYPSDDAVRLDDALQRFFDKLIPAFNYQTQSEKPVAKRFPSQIHTRTLLQEVLAMFMWQFSVQHTVVNDGAYDMAAFVPNASTLMYALPNKPSSDWTPEDVLRCLPSQDLRFPDLGNMTFLDVQLNASVTGQGPYPETIFGRGVLQPSVDVLQDSYGFVEPTLRRLVDQYFQAVRIVGEKIQRRQSRDVSHFLALHPEATAVPNTVSFDLLTPSNVMATIET